MSVQLPTADPQTEPQTRPVATRVGTSATGRSTGARPPTVRAAITATSKPARRLSPQVRKWLVAAHVLVAVGWFGIVAAKLVLEIVAATTGTPDVVRAGYLFTAALDRAAFPPAALATLITGIILSVGTLWGLFRYWWIVAKLVLTVAVIVTGVVFVGAWTEAALADPSTTTTGSASAWLIGAAITHLLMLGAATVISVLKPWGEIGGKGRRAVD